MQVWTGLDYNSKGLNHTHTRQPPKLHQTLYCTLSKEKGTGYCVNAGKRYHSVQTPNCFINSVKQTISRNYHVYQPLGNINQGSFIRHRLCSCLFPYLHKASFVSLVSQAYIFRCNLCNSLSITNVSVAVSIRKQEGNILANKH